MKNSGKLRHTESVYGQPDKEAFSDFHIRKLFDDNFANSGAYDLYTAVQSKNQVSPKTQFRENRKKPKMVIPFFEFWTYLLQANSGQNYGLTWFLLCNLVL